jgi:adenine-specific DNA-methyltransferase
VGSRYDHLNHEELLRLLEARDRRYAETKFGLVWEADDIERERARNADFVALDVVKELSCGSAPWRNLIIEGDNFDALRHLRMCFAGQVKCIYIDPPYNTGNRDFVYNDRFVDREDSWRHSKWCEFMFQRLMIARDLLREDGVIFVSIDDNELFALGLMLNRIFGESNRLACFAWQTDGNFDNQAKVKICHEYILAYACRIDQFPAPPVIDPTIPKSSKLFRTAIRNTIVKNGPKNPVSPIRLLVGFPAAIQSGTIPARQDKWPKFEDDLVIAEGRLAKSAEVLSGWSSKELCEDFIKRDREPVRDAKGQTTRFELSATGAIEAVKARSEAQSHVISVIRGFGSTQAQGVELAAAGIEFSYPKPLGLLQYLVSMIADPEAIILDFFAGSGTTAHAVHKLNAEDGGHRRVILVSSTEATEDAPDKNLCRDVCATRVRRVIEGYTPSGGEPVPGLGGDFAYLRTRRIPAARLLEIDHAQVWTALQLMHGFALTPYAEGPFAWVGDEDEAVMFLPRFRREDAPVLRRQLKRSAAVALYSWQPSAVEQHLRAGHVTHLQIPETLARRFGLGQGGKR